MINMKSTLSFNSVQKTIKIRSLSLNAISENELLKREFEIKLYDQGYPHILGSDEAGRGCLAGPVVAAAVCVPKSHTVIETVRDSKLISKKKREEIYNIIMNDVTIFKDYTVIDNKKIDDINILNASLLAMEMSLQKVMNQINNQNSIESSSFVALIDGNRCPKNLKVKTIPIIKGDKLVYSIALASIIAKVKRDEIMDEYHKLYPNYNFINNYGYPTKQHFLLLHKYGPSPIHRISTKPVQRILFNHQEE